MVACPIMDITLSPSMALPTIMLVYNIVEDVATPTLLTPIIACATGAPAYERLLELASVITEPPTIDLPTLLFVKVVVDALDMDAKELPTIEFPIGMLENSIVADTATAIAEAPTIELATPPPAVWSAACHPVPAWFFANQTILHQLSRSNQVSD